MVNCHGWVQTYQVVTQQAQVALFSPSVLIAYHRWKSHRSWEWLPWRQSKPDLWVSPSSLSESCASISSHTVQIPPSYPSTHRSIQSNDDIRWPFPHWCNPNRDRILFNLRCSLPPLCVLPSAIFTSNPSPFPLLICFRAGWGRSTSASAVCTSAPSPPHFGRRRSLNRGLGRHLWPELRKEIEEASLSHRHRWLIHLLHRTLPLLRSCWPYCWTPLWSSPTTSPYKARPQG